MTKGGSKQEPFNRLAKGAIFKHRFVMKSTRMCALSLRAHKCSLGHLANCTYNRSFVALKRKEGKKEELPCLVTWRDFMITKGDQIKWPVPRFLYRVQQTGTSAMCHGEGEKGTITDPC